MADVTLRERPAMLRRWTVLAAVLAITGGWASTLASASASPGPSYALASKGSPSYEHARSPAPPPGASQGGQAPAGLGTLPGIQVLIGGGKHVPPAGVAGPAGASAPPRVDCERRKCVALTFDDGPGSPTARLLDILARNHVRATFFLVGQNVASKPAMVRRELAAGHELGNHSYTHADLGRSSAAKIRSEIGRTQEAVHRAAGVRPTLLRPPYGSTDAAVAAVARHYRLPQILWAVDPNDWKDRNARIVERRVVGGARPGYIVLMHDIHRTTVDAVPAILRRLAAKGYVFVTVSELFRGKTLTPGKKYSHR